ncbi:23S rRNA pseudouridine(955/2504/2580) synthase RluC [Candidatus Pantoea edessiphila]|uniref:Pseudouridine synthase n=1 Tax=Candidatus Pantoea edessiphila TaxID=2044610 RepID=A0A2P5T2F5_9GAMM|nr:23S rRNA pseudouridine(955/2504/2580) synthase RluC [Candidatus Pantoea edessiphila]PPI88769.1 23S rRNA pseudouridine(955/2504/2580) synthase RluC [Candidatus Pantoea edessiphila]
MKKKYFDLQKIFISDKNSNQRVDNFLYSKLKKPPKNFIYKILRKGEVKINNKRVKPLYKLQINDEVLIPTIYLSEKKEKILPLNLNNISLLDKAILYEDDYLIIINKPSGIAVHGGSGLSFGIIELIRALRPDFSFFELVHRIDRDTSGLLLIAKKRSILRSLHEQLRNKSIKKNYLTVVNGIWPISLQTIKVPLIKRIPKYGKSMVYVDINGKPSETHFQVKEYFKFATLIKASPITGYTHQIRVHALHAGHPILFDKRYGNHLFDKNFFMTGLNRLFLHAFSLSFIHPKTGKNINIEAPIDETLKRCLDILRC